MTTARVLENFVIDFSNSFDNRKNVSKICNTCNKSFNKTG